MKERELQLERQNTKVEHLKSQIDVMALTLAESKGTPSQRALSPTPELLAVPILV